MPQDINQQIDTMRRRLQVRQIFIATCWLLATLLVCVAALAVVDWLLGISDPLGRMLCSFTLIMLIALAARRWLNFVWHQRFTTMSVAHGIEHHHPELRDVVTSALHFNHQSSAETGAGSESLRRAVVLRAAASLANTDWRQLISPLAWRRAWAIAAILLVTGVLVWQSPTLFNIGFSRLLNPFSTAEWPRENDLQFLDPPTVLAAGDDLVLKLRDNNGSLPSPVLLQTRTNGKVNTITIPTTSSPQELRLPNVQQSLAYRAIGGDHTTMRWHQLNVVPPPRIESLRTTLNPPAYSNMPTRRFGSGESVLEGSQLSISARLSRQVTSVELKTTAGQSIPAKLDQSGTIFSASVDQLHTYSNLLITFHISTADGLNSINRRKLVLNVIPDRNPSVVFVLPTETISVTPSAVVPLLVHAKDDLAIKEINLLVRRSQQSLEEKHTLNLYQGPQPAIPPPDGRIQQSSHLLQLNKFDLTPGDTLNIDAQAADYRPAIGITDSPLKLNVVSELELSTDIARRETNLIERLQKLLRLQTELHSRSTDWQNQSDWDNVQWKTAVNQMLIKQQQLATSLGGRRNGLIPQLEIIIADFQRNGLYRPDTKLRLQSLHDLLTRLVNDTYPTIDTLLVQWIRQAQSVKQQSAIDRSQIIEDLLHNQEFAIEAFQQAINLLSQENTLARYQNQIASLQTLQEQLAEQTRNELLASSADIQPSSRQSGKKISQQQRQLSRDFAKLVLQMSHSAEQQSPIAGQLSDVVALANELSIQATMRSAADHLAQQQFGQAISQEQQIVADLQKMQKRLTGDQKNSNSTNNASGNAKDQQGKQPGTESQADGKIGAGTTPQESTDPVGQGVETVDNVTDIANQLIQDLWGHLPERRREQILQPLREEFIPKYAPEIEAYFRAFATPQEAREQ